MTLPPKYIQSVKAFLSWDESERPPVWSHTQLTPGSVKWRDLITSCWVEERELRAKHFVLRRRLISLTCCFYGLVLIDVGTVTFTQMDMWSIQWISKNLVEEWQTETERLKILRACQRSNVISLQCHRAIWQSSPMTYSRLHQIIVSAEKKKRRQQQD